MEVHQIQLDSINDIALLKRLKRFQPQWVQIIADPKWMEYPQVIAEIKKIVPEVIVTGYSAPWQIEDREIKRKSMVINAVCFKNPLLDVKLFAINEFKSSKELGSSVGQYLSENKNPPSVLFMPVDTIPLSDFYKGVRDISDATLMGGEGGTGAPNWDSFVISEEGFSDNQLIVLSFKDGVEFEKYTWPNLAVKVGEEPGRGEVESFILVEGTHINSDTLAYNPEDVIHKLSRVYSVNHSISGFLSGKNVAAFEKKEMETSKEVPIVITQIRDLDY
jgi:hypothetical protein